MQRRHIRPLKGEPAGFNEVTLLGRAREAAGLTQTELASRAGMPREHISRYETFTVEPLVGRAIAIAKALNQPVEELFSDFIGRKNASR